MMKFLSFDILHFLFVIHYFFLVLALSGYEVEVESVRRGESGVVGQWMKK